MLIIFILYVFTYLADVIVWLLTMPDRPFNFRWLKRFYLIRMAGTAFNYVTPLASIGGEPIKAMLLKNHYGISYRDSGISIVLAKTADVIGLVLFLTLGFIALTFSTKIGDTQKSIAGVGLLVLVICITGFFLVQRYKITSTGANWLSKTSIGQKLQHALELIHDLEDKLIHFYTEHRSRFMITMGLALLNWSLGTIEVYLVMQFLDHPITLADALIIESFAQLVRAGTFFIPASIGAQDGAFFLICNTITGVPELGVAVAMIRRFREIVWIALGLFIWWLYSLKPEMKVANLESAD
jgi:uncharacterized protein (TIRG00374 family)